MFLETILIRFRYIEGSSHPTGPLKKGEDREDTATPTKEPYQVLFLLFQFDRPGLESGPVARGESLRPEQTLAVEMGVPTPGRHLFP